MISFQPLIFLSFPFQNTFPYPSPPIFGLVGKEKSRAKDNANESNLWLPYPIPPPSRKENRDPQPAKGNQEDLLTSSAKPAHVLFGGHILSLSLCSLCRPFSLAFGLTPNAESEVERRGAKQERKANSSFKHFGFLLSPFPTPLVMALSRLSVFPTVPGLVPCLLSVHLSHVRGKRRVRSSGNAQISGAAP